MNAFQDPDASSTTANLVATLQSLGWVDKTALGVLLVFFVLGLFKGLIWQVSRIGILVAAYVVAGRFGRDVAVLLGASETSLGRGTGPAAAAVEGQPDTAAAGSLADVPQGETTLYIAYCLLFVVVLIVLSLAAILVKKLVDRAGLSFFDRLGGGVLGVATGACVVLAMLFGINMFFPTSELSLAAEGSHSLRFSQRAISWLGKAVDDDLRSVLSLQPLGVSAPDGQTGDGSGMGDEASGQPAIGVGSDQELPKMPTPLPLPPGMELEGGGSSAGGDLPQSGTGSTARTNEPSPHKPGGGIR